MGCESGCQEGRSEGAGVGRGEGVSDDIKYLERGGGGLGCGFGEIGSLDSIECMSLWGDLLCVRL